MLKIATPISHLFENKEFAKKIVKYSDCLECRDRSINSQEKVQELFHCELQPIHRWDKKEFKYLKHIRKSKKSLKLISFHIASCCDKPIIKNNMFELGGKQYSKKEMLNNAKNNFKRIKKIFGNKVIIAVENNNYYPTKAYKHITEAEFISRIVYDNNIYFLFDIAHAKVTSYNKNINFEKYKSNLPLDRCIQLHICSYAIDKQNDLAYDAHNLPDEEELIEVKKLLKDYKNIKYLTVEHYKDIKNLLESLKKIKGIINELS